MGQVPLSELLLLVLVSDRKFYWSWQDIAYITDIKRDIKNSLIGIPIYKKDSYYKTINHFKLTV